MCKATFVHFINPFFVFSVGYDSVRYMFIINPLNAELNPIYHFLVLVGAHHILHVNRVFSVGYDIVRYMFIINPSTIELNPIYHFLVLVGAHHILHLSRLRVKYPVDIYCSLRQSYIGTTKENVSPNISERSKK